MDERTLFLAALDKPSPTDRAAFLDAACSDSELRARVADLLQAHDKVGTFLGRPAVNTTERLAEGPGTIIGRYKLLQLIGEGGMGAVFMAEQSDPVRRMVALKVIKPGMDSRQVVARFEAERQALALMDHPNIAKVFDAGTTASGRPYFVMELVKGVPITTYCDQNHLTPRERLELFVPVCQAVQHAHQQGVIHRDLKPNNVLVALYDDRPVPKVIDFGVAKAIRQRLTERTLFTEFGTVVGTLEYMAPEQAVVNQIDIDTRADVYALGVLLYELLTGTTPVSRARLREAAFDDLLRIIREEEPPKPSTRVSSSAELPSVAANRRTEPTKLGKLFRGELDWITMKALEKDRGRRYATANGLALDVQRHLADEPIEARPPSRTYRLRKFVRRNRGWATAAVVGGLLMLALIVLSMASVVSVRQMRDMAELERARAAEAQYRAEENFRQARSAVERMLTEVGDQTLRDADSGPVQRKELLDQAIEYYRQLAQSEADPLARGQILQKSATVHRLLGNLPSARAAEEQALRLFELATTDDPTVLAHRRHLAVSLSSLGALAADEGRTDEALASFGRAIDTLEVVRDKVMNDPQAQMELRNAYWGRAQVLARLGRSTDADRDFGKILEMLPSNGRDEVYVARAIALARGGQHAVAASQTEEPTQGPDTAPTILYGAARALALCSAAAKDDAPLAERYASRAVELLRRAATAGYFRDPAHVERLRKDDDLAPLRDRKDYRDFLAEIQK